MTFVLCRFYGDTPDKMHFDQPPNRKGMHAYQGAIYLKEAQHDDYCFVLMENSHKFIEEFFEAFSVDMKRSSSTLTEEERDWYKKRGCPIKRIPVPQGGLLLWDSRY